MSRVGMERALVEGGIDIVDQINPNPDALVRRAAESGPDAIVLGDGPSNVNDLRARLRHAVPKATLVLWRTDAVAVLDPGAEAPRVMPTPAPRELSNQLFRRVGKGDTCPST
jgi:hypothetical protein